MDKYKAFFYFFFFFLKIFEKFFLEDPFGGDKMIMHYNDFQKFL